MGVLDGKVVLVMGGGCGIGSEMVFFCVKEGVKVVVNDLGGGEVGGDEGDVGLVVEVVDEIKKVGGEVILNFDFVIDIVVV